MIPFPYPHDHQHWLLFMLLPCMRVTRLFSHPSPSSSYIPPLPRLFREPPDLSYLREKVEVRGIATMITQSSFFFRHGAKLYRLRAAAPHHPAPSVNQKVPIRYPLGLASPPLLPFCVDGEHNPLPKHIWEKSPRCGEAALKSKTVGQPPWCSRKP